MKKQRIQNTQKMKGLTLFDFKIYYKAIVIKTQDT